MCVCVCMTQLAQSVLKRHYKKETVILKFCKKLFTYAGCEGVHSVQSNYYLTDE